MVNKYDELSNLIASWSAYLKLHKRVYENKNMKVSWHIRMNNIETKINKWKIDKGNL